MILPGFVEGHSHAYEGGVWKFPYVGYLRPHQPRRQALARAEEHRGGGGGAAAYEKTMPKDGSTLFAWGFDPIYFTGRRMNLADLDKVSTERPVVIVLHSNFHVLNANTPVFAKAEHHAPHQRPWHREGRGGRADRRAAGERPRSTWPTRPPASSSPTVLSDEPATWRFARVAQLAGVTTATDLHNTLPDSTVEAYLRGHRLGRLSDPPAAGLRRRFGAAGRRGIARLKALMKKNNEQAALPAW